MTALIDTLTPAELRQEYGATLLELDALGKTVARQRGEIERLREALRRYYIFEQFLGEDKLYAEFGPPEFPESSISCEEWLERVLREPARAVLESE